jgi:hypothetical protein
MGISCKVSISNYGAAQEFSVVKVILAGFRWYFVGRELLGWFDGPQFFKARLQRMAKCLL